MQLCHTLRLALISSIIVAEPLLSNTLMIIYIAAAAILLIRLAQYQVRISEQQAVKRAVCQMKREIIAAVARPHEQ